MAHNDGDEPPNKVLALCLPRCNESQATARRNLLDFLKKRLSHVQLHYHEFIAELAYLQGGGLLTEFDSWRRQRPQELMHALCSGHLDAEDLNIISSFVSGYLPFHEIFPVEADQTALDNPETDSDEDERCLDEAAIGSVVRKEVDTLRRVMELKQRGLWSRDVSSQFGAGGADKSKPSLSSLAPPPELTRTKDHSDYLFAELHWLAEDYKKERHWKKLAYAALKVHREKAERSHKAEREEMIRVRKQCALIARLVREWWRQMDKIVQAKQKVRLTAKHQQAMNTHLGHVIETTEKYTLWLTEGITGASAIQSNPDATTDSEPTTGQPVSEPSGPADQRTPLKIHQFWRIGTLLFALLTTLNVSRADVADSEASEDDEETIAKEEELAKQELEAQGICPSETQSAEIEALCKEAEASIIDLLPPGYLEHLNQELDSDVQASSSSPPSVEQNDSAPASPIKVESVTESAKPEKDTAFVPDPNDSSTDDEATVAEQEAHEAAVRATVAAEDSDAGPSQNATQEVNALEAEAEMPLEDLLARYGLDPAGLGQTPTEVEEGAPPSADEKRPKEDEESDSDSSGSSSDSSASASSDVSHDSEDSDREASSSNSEEEDVGLKNLFDDAPDKNAPNNTDSKTSPTSKQSEATSKDDAELNALTADAMSAQPQGNTLASTMANVKTPFLLTGTLREYQIVGLSWLAAIYEKRLNGILADEMGLGKTIQTIALLAHLACEMGIWGPHLIVVPTSVILNWEVEFKRWCPGFKILTYFGNLKERKLKRKGWTKTNAFHVCITSYRLAIQDSSAFKRKKWKYLILDEAQNIKNFKSQRWQTLLTFTSQRRLLLTGTPLQNSLMELWSLMHFLMPNIFQSHREFQEWFASPLTGMIEGNSEYNEQLVMRLHKVLRPFLLRRLKDDVERQMPKKYEHVIMCRLSRRQRYLYDDFMSLSSTRDTLASGQFLSVMNILMQLRKVCNHPNLFEPRPIVSPFVMGSDDLSLEVPRLVASASHPFLVVMPRTCGQNLQLVYRPSAWSD
ncbi:unnamed protein product, partial [Dibothriocephalus latus]